MAESGILAKLSAINAFATFALGNGHDLESSVGADRNVGQTEVASRLWWADTVLKSQRAHWSLSVAMRLLRDATHAVVLPHFFVALSFA
jgi:hypothetical protein